MHALVSLIRTRRLAIDAGILTLAYKQFSGTVKKNIKTSPLLRSRIGNKNIPHIFFSFRCFIKIIQVLNHFFFILFG